MIWHYDDILLNSRELMQVASHPKVANIEQDNIMTMSASCIKERFDNSLAARDYPWV